ncbi:hypothetical protein C8J56DRAFT_1108633 [Mycena floridula]|nr:hypothetical protein C8J56DRAFT_1108633 [Mycena floridula]
MADTVETAEHFIYVTQIYFCAMYAVVIWDWLTSLPREWRFVWKTHWTPVKVAYLFCRQVSLHPSLLDLICYWVIGVVPYLLFCFVNDHTWETCQRIYRIPVALAMWNQVGSESVLLIRTYAFFNRNFYVLLFLIAALSGVVAYQLYVDTTQMLRTTDCLQTRGPCLPMSKPHSAHLLGFFIAPLLFDTVVTFMTVIKAITIRRRHGGPNSRLIQTFLREGECSSITISSGVFYYILISIANLINGIFYLQPRQVISAINIPLSVMMAPILACRLILDLRERGSETVSHSEGTGMAAFTTKSLTQHQSSPFTPPHHRKSAHGRYSARARPYDSNIILTTLDNHYSTMSIDREILEMDDIHDDIHLPMGIHLESLSTAVGGEDGEPLPDDSGFSISCDERSQAPSNSSKTAIPTYRGLEIGFRPRAPSLSEGIRGIRVDVEKATATL